MKAAKMHARNSCQPQKTKIMKSNIFRGLSALWCTLLLGGAAHARQIAVNIVLVGALRVPVSTEAQLNSLPGTNKSTTVQYLDGLGRNIQEVTVGTAPSGADQVSITEYDTRGLEPAVYLSLIHI